MPNVSHQIVDILPDVVSKSLFAARMHPLETRNINGPSFHEDRPPGRHGGRRCWFANAFKHHVRRLKSPLHPSLGRREGLSRAVHSGQASRIWAYALRDRSLEVKIGDGLPFVVGKGPKVAPHIELPKVATKEMPHLLSDVVEETFVILQSQVVPQASHPSA